MALPDQVIDDIVLAKQYYSDLSAVYTESLYKGGCDCEILVLLIELNSIIDSMEYERDGAGILSNVINTYYKMMEIIGGVPFIPLYITFYREGDDIFAVTNKDYDGEFSKEDYHLFITQGIEFDNIEWSLQGYNLIVST